MLGRGRAAGPATMNVIHGLSSRSLTDHHHEWCALCLKYLPGSEPRELHHVVNQARIRNRFGRSLDFAWVAPADPQCHKRLQGIADAAAVYFVELLDGAQTLVDREGIARRFHDQGYYWLSALTNLDTMRSRVEGMDDEEWWRRCEFALSSSAGIRGGKNLPGLLLADLKSQRPRIQLNLSNLHAARGHRLAAQRSFKDASLIIASLPRKEQASLMPGHLRRQAQLSRSTADAREAVSAAESDYSKDTALVFLGILGLSRGELSSAEESLELLLARTGRMGWLYQAETQFIRGLHLILTGSKDIGAVYSSLSVAQYIYVVLGLQMSITPELPFPCPFGRSWDWTPSDALRAFFAALPSSKVLGESECFDIRLRSIRDTRLLERILHPIVGWGGDLQPGGGHLVPPGELGTK